MPGLPAAAAVAIVRAATAAKSIIRPADDLSARLTTASSCALSGADAEEGFGEFASTARYASRATASLIGSCSGATSQTIFPYSWK